MFLNKKQLTEITYGYFFVAFIFFSAIFCNVSKVNLLFHFATILFILSIFFVPQVRNEIFKDRVFLNGLVIPAVFLLYFALTNIWSSNPSNTTSTLKHGFYLMAFMILYRQVEKMGLKKHVMGAVYFGMIILSILTFINIDRDRLFTGRLQNGFSWAPDNVIDLGGYMAIGILCGIIFIRETGRKWLYIFTPILFATLLLTQSRGPLLAMVVALIIIFMIKPSLSKKHILYAIIVCAITLFAISLTQFSDVFIKRMESSYQQSFIRLGIWHHTLDLVKDKWLFGWGYDKALAYKLNASKTISTTHTIYLASLLKGGVIGFGLLISVIIYGLARTVNHLKNNHNTEASLFLFSILYYLTQGMFIIGNPQEFWFLFWFPLAVVLSTPIKNI